MRGEGTTDWKELNRNEHERSHEHALGRSMWMCDFFNPTLYMVAATAADNGARAALYRTS